MARGAEARLRRRNERKKAREEEDENPFIMAPVEDDDSAEEEQTGAPVESAASKKKKPPPPPAKKKKQPIKTLPLVLLIILTGTTVLPALIYLGDFLGAAVQKHHVLGAIGYKLGLGPSPKKRVLSFYEKHDPSKIDSVDKILAKHYGEYDKMIKRMERKYGDYGYFLGWEEDEAPMRLALEHVADTRDYLAEQFNIYAPQFLKTAVRNFRYNVGTLYKKFRKVWRKHLWPMLEPIFGVPKGGAAQKRKDAQEARERRASAGGGKKTRRRNTEFRDDVEDEH